MQKNILNKIEKLFLDTEGMNDKLTPFEIDIIIERLSLIKRFLKKGNWLDLCSGKGISKQIVKFNPKINYYGLDFILENCKISNSIMPSRVICADAANIPFKKNSFDYVTVMAAIYYLNRDELINEIKKVLKVNGLFIFDTSNCDQDFFHAARESNGYHNKMNWINFLSKNGFSVTCFESEFTQKSSLINKLYLRLKLIIKLITFRFTFFKKIFFGFTKKIKKKVIFDEKLFNEKLKKKNNLRINNKNVTSKTKVLYFVCKKLP